MGRICLYGGAWAKTETAAVYLKGFDLFGISQLLEVWISDNSKAAAKLASTYAAKVHVLCFQHFRQHLWDAIASFTHEAKKTFWNKVMKIMKWRGYRDDHALLHDINALILDCVPESRCHELVTELKHLRQKLCIYHVSQFCTMMRVASSIAESTHSAIKGGGEFKKMLRASNFYETMLHILQLMKIYIDDTVADLKRFKDKGWHYSPYARSFIDKAWASMAQCTRLTQETDNCWHVVQNVPEFKGGKETSQYTLPPYVQLHIVTFPEGGSNATCTCPEYTQGLRMCSAVCAVLMRLGRGKEHTNVSQLHEIWHLRNHPFWCLVDDPSIPLPFCCTTPSTHTCLPEQQEKQLSIQPNHVLRLATLQAAFQEVVLPSLKSPHFEALHTALLQHKQSISGQSLEHPPAFAPRTLVDTSHTNSGSVPDALVVNKSRMSAKYVRGAKGRVERATARDPLAYSLHKRGAPGADILCDCGVTLKNTKQARAYHMNKNKVHAQWLISLASSAGGSQVQQSGGEGVPVHAPDAAGSGEDGGGVPVRLQGSCASPFLSILTRHRVPSMHHMLLVVMMKMVKVFRYVCKVLVLRLF